MSATGTDSASRTPGRTPNSESTRAPRGSSRTRWTEHRTPRRSAASAKSGQRASSSVSGQLTAAPSPAASSSGPEPALSWRSASSARSGWVAAALTTSPSSQTAACAPEHEGTCQAASSASLLSDLASPPLVRLSSSAASCPSCSIGTRSSSSSFLARPGWAGGGQAGPDGRGERLAAGGQDGEADRLPARAAGQPRGRDRLAHRLLRDRGLGRAGGPGGQRRDTAHRVAGLAGGGAARAAAEQRAHDDRGEHDGNKHDGVDGRARLEPAQPPTRERLRQDGLTGVEASEDLVHGGQVGLAGPQCAFHPVDYALLARGQAHLTLTSSPRLLHRKDRGHGRPSPTRAFRQQTAPWAGVVSSRIRQGLSSVTGARDQSRTDRD